MEQQWESAFGNNIDVVGWKGETNTFETIRFNGTGLFDRQSKNLRDYLEDAILNKDVDAISGAAPKSELKGK